MTLSSYIHEDLKAHIRAGDDLPFELTLKGIAEHYAVSSTPVRAAVRELIAEHYLRRASNGRLVLDPATMPDEPLDLDVERPTLPPDARDAIARDVMLSSVRGNTDFLREEAMAGCYGVSRTVVRQVFNRLVGNGILEHAPRLGWRVRPFSEADMCAYLEVREVLELKALDLAQPHLDRADLESMFARNPVPRSGQAVQLDNRIHKYLVEKAGNRYLRDFFERHGEYYMLLFEQAALEAKVVAEMAEQHRAILRALIDEDWDGARQALVRHIRSQRPVMRKLLSEMAANPIPHGETLRAYESGFNGPTEGWHPNGSPDTKPEGSWRASPG